jgi:hypothetical protein
VPVTFNITAEAIKGLVIPKIFLKKTTGFFWRWGSLKVIFNID